MFRKFSPGFSRAVNRLLRSLPGTRHATATAADPDAATTMEKLDATLNNMSHGLCMFGPDNRLLLWNERYVKMYRLAPDRLRVGSTLDEMLEARKAAGTAYRDLGHYGSKLREVITTRSPDNLVAQLDDGRIVNVSYRPTQNGCWVSTHEDITERAERGKDRASGISRPAHRPAERGGIQRVHRKHPAEGGRRCLVCGAVC
jgi:PAS domain-containing protein